MRKLFIVFMVLFTIESIAQKPLSKGAIKEFARTCEYNFQYDRSFFTITLVNALRSDAGSLEEANLIMISTETNPVAREKVFRGFYLLNGGDRDKIQISLFDWGISAVNAKLLADYISKKKFK